jgi:hypothetical protein
VHDRVEDFGGSISEGREGGSVDPDRVLRHNLHGAVVENDRLRG